MYSCLTLTHTRAAQSVEEFSETKKYYEKETFHRKQLETSRLEMDRDTLTLDFVLFLNAETSPLKEYPFLLFRVNFKLARVRVQQGQKSFIIIEENGIC